MCVNQDVWSTRIHSYFEIPLCRKNKMASEKSSAKKGEKFFIRNNCLVWLVTGSILSAIFTRLNNQNGFRYDMIRCHHWGFVNIFLGNVVRLFDFSPSLKQISGIIFDERSSDFFQVLSIGYDYDDPNIFEESDDWRTNPYSSLLCCWDHRMLLSLFVLGEGFWEKNSNALRQIPSIYQYYSTFEWLKWLTKEPFNHFTIWIVIFSSDLASLSRFCFRIYDIS